MNLPLFPIGITNVFPMTNSVNGGQLATEFNMRSRESVATPQEIQYIVGPTYVHSERDFVVSVDNNDRSKLIVSPGRALINGHYVETLDSITIDLPAAMAASGTPISGDLTIGIRMMYADSAISGATMTVNAYSGSLFAEDNTTQTYKGVQFVILPKNDFKIPTEVPTSEASVTAHLRLANFRYVNGRVGMSIENVAYSQQGGVLDASRIFGLHGLLDEEYVSIAKLRPNEFYTFAGKPIIDDEGQVVTSGQDTWCKSTDSIMVWDKNPQSDRTDVVNASQYGNVTEAKFEWNSDAHQLDFVIPHKQIDGGMIVQDDLGYTHKYYPKVISIPEADFKDLNSYGLVGGNYSAKIYDMINDIHTELFSMFGSQHTQRAYISVLEQSSELPRIAGWDIYDFVVVGQDKTVGAYSTDSNYRPPATIYMVVPKPAEILNDTQYSTIPLTTEPTYGKRIAELVLDRPFTTSFITDIPDINAQLAVIKPLGLKDDYFTVRYTNAMTYWVVTYEDVYNTQYSDPIWLTYEIPLASEEAIGGFKNVSQSQLGAGYVYRDAQGHLRVLDYEQLASGALAYQLGEDVEYLNLTLEELQNQLNDYVCSRVAFPNATQIYNAYQSTMSDMYVDPSVINVTIQLPDDSSADSPQILTINDIDSRFGGSVYLHILGSATTNTTVQIKNCAKIRIDNHIGGTPNIVIENSNLFYDASILNYATSISGLSIWYEIDHSQYDSTEQEEAAQQIYVDGMTVYQKNVPMVAQDIDAFASDSGNDLHYSIGLDSITLDTYGDVVGCGIRIADDITSNNSDETSFVVATFDLPQGHELKYPFKKMSKKIKISGEFMSAYPVSEPDCTHHLHTSTFTLATQPYSASMDDAQMVPCTLSIRTEIARITPTVYSYESSVSPSGQVIFGLESNDSYVFEGKVAT